MNNLKSRAGLTDHLPTGFPEIQTGRWHIQTLHPKSVCPSVASAQLEKARFECRIKGTAMGLQCRPWQWALIAQGSTSKRTISNKHTVPATQVGQEPATSPPPTQGGSFVISITIWTTRHFSSHTSNSLLLCFKFTDKEWAPVSLGNHPGPQ